MSEQHRIFYLISFIFSLIAALLVLLDDFGGWTENTYYGTNDYFVFIGSENAPLYGQVLLGVIGLGLLAITYLSYQGMQSKITPAQMNIALQISVSILVLVVAGAINLAISASDAVDWWLDVGFYAGFFGSGISAFFLYRIKSESPV